MTPDPLRGSTLELERSPHRSRTPGWYGHGRARPLGAADALVTVPGPERADLRAVAMPDDWDVMPSDGGAPRLTGAGFRSPVLVLLASVALLAGYRLLGVIHGGDSALSTFASSRIGAALAGLVLPLAAVALSRTDTDGTRPAGRTVVLIASATMMVAALLVLVIGGSVATTLLGVADLMLAAAALGAVALAERINRRLAERTRSLAQELVDVPSAPQPLVGPTA